MRIIYGGFKRKQNSNIRNTRKTALNYIIQITIIKKKYTSRIRRNNIFRFKLNLHEVGVNIIHINTYMTYEISNNGFNNIMIMFVR